MAVRTIAENVGFCEGPVVRPNGDVVFVSIDQGRLYSLTGTALTTLAELPGGPNGAAEWSDGTMFVAQTGGRWGGNSAPDWSLLSGVQAVAPDGAMRWVSTDPIAPNDLCFGPDNRLYITDPTRYHAVRDDGRIFGIDIASGRTELLTTVSWYVNGIGFSREDDAMYVANSGPDFGIMRFPFDDGKLGKAELFCSTGTYIPDGFLFDSEGNLTVAVISTTDVPGQIQTYDRNGRLIDAIVPSDGKVFTNVALTPDRTLIVTASGEGRVFAIDGWPYSALPLHPFR